MKKRKVKRENRARELEREEEQVIERRIESMESERIEKRECEGWIRRRNKRKKKKVTSWRLKKVTKRNGGKENEVRRARVERWKEEF